MNLVNNDKEFKGVLKGLKPAQQREVAAVFVHHVLHLSDDPHISHALRAAMQTDVLDDELASALKSAKHATIDHHARCGAEGHWDDQAGYFVARATVAALTPLEHSREGGPAWQAAMAARMAYTSMLIDDVTDQHPAHTECEWQYQALADYLTTIQKSD